ncbi:hypothetical protein SFUMM280S_10619 [Streptomyces fumanus]
MPHTMSRMGDVLAGSHAAWEFGSDSVLIRYERGLRTPRLFQALGERRIPVEAIAGVTLAPGRRGTVVLQLQPRAGADPLMEAAAGQLKESCDPYRLVLPAEREPLAGYWADELRGQLPEAGAGPAERHLVAAPEPPLQSGWVRGGARVPAVRAAVLAAVRAAGDAAVPAPRCRTSPSASGTSASCTRRDS